jgi:hypothetical protein
MSSMTVNPYSKSLGTKLGTLIHRRFHLSTLLLASARSFFPAAVTSKKLASVSGIPRTYLSLRGQAPYDHDLRLGCWLVELLLEFR